MSGVTRSSRPRHEESRENSCQCEGVKTTFGLRPYPRVSPFFRPLEHDAHDGEPPAQALRGHEVWRDEHRQIPGGDRFRDHSVRTIPRPPAAPELTSRRAGRTLTGGTASQSYAARGQATRRRLGRPTSSSEQLSRPSAPAPQTSALRSPTYSLPLSRPEPTRPTASTPSRLNSSKSRPP
jgi:hypothetical protein